MARKGESTSTRMKKTFSLPSRVVSGILLLTLALLAGCVPEAPPTREPGRDFRADMRDLVCRIGRVAREMKPGFLVIPQNGLELLTRDGRGEGEAVSRYIACIDGVAQESLFFGYDGMDRPTPRSVRERLIPLAALARKHDLPVLVTDYCRDKARVDRSRALNLGHDHLSFAASSRDLDHIPAYPDPPAHLSCGRLSRLEEARNFLYILNLSAFPSKDAFVDTVYRTRYDILVTDPFFLGTVPFTRREVLALKRKACGGNRLVLAYLSIGEAEDYRPYWKAAWKAAPPPWLEEENPDWPGNYKVRYWMEDWQEILLGGEGSRLHQIVDAGFDGVYLDIIDAFEYFEAREKQED